MKYYFKKFLTITIIFCLMICTFENVFAHSGKTDSNGGHKDNKNKSGLGSYHYHCGGYPAHLHYDGICPYSDTKTSSKSATSTNIQEKINQVIGIKIDESIKSMKVGETKKLTVTLIPENIKYKSITWTTEDKDIATVSSEGNVVALNSGVVNITVTTDNGKTDTMTIIVEKADEMKQATNNIVTPIQSKEENNTGTDSSEDSNTISGILGLGLIGGGSYLGFKKYKKSKK